jgi:predicted dehydrogenase
VSVRVGVIGTGFGARVVAPVFRDTPGCEVVDVVSARDDAAVAELCDRDDLDLVSVHSPPFLHGPHVRRALRREHAVVCDKPFGVDAADAETLLGAAEAAESIHLVNFEFRFDPMRRLLRDLVRDGAVGTPEHVGWTHLSAGSVVPMRPYGWLFDRASGGGWVGAWGSHVVDTLRWMLGEVVDAHGACRTVVRERTDAEGVPHACDAEDAFSAWLTLSGGTTVVIDSSFAAPAHVAPRIVVVGTEGILESVADTRIVVRRADGTTEEHTRPSADGDVHLLPMRRWIEVIRDAVLSGAPAEEAATFADGLACARVLDAIRGSGPRS